VSDLLPCPFCGEVASLRLFDRLSAPEAWVVCGRCNASSGWYSTEERAIAAWNRRPPATAEARVRGEEPQP